MDYTGCPKKVIEFPAEITLKIFGLEHQFSYFWKAQTLSHLAGLKVFKARLTSQDGIRYIITCCAQLL